MKTRVVKLKSEINFSHLTLRGLSDHIWTLRIVVSLSVSSYECVVKG